MRRQVPLGEVVELEGAGVHLRLGGFVGEDEPRQHPRVVAGTERAHQEPVLQVLGPERVFPVRDRAPGIVAADSGLAEVHRQRDLFAGAEFGPVGPALRLAAVEVGDPVGQGGKRQVGQPDDQESRPRVVGERRPAHVAARARLLRAHVGVGEFGHRRPVAADRGPRPAVPVVLVGPASVPLRLAQRGGQREEGPEPRHLGQVLAHAGKPRGDRHRSVPEDLVQQRVEGIDRTE